MSNILNAFNDHLIEFFNDLILVFPYDLDLKTCLNFIKVYRKMNPKLLIKVWKKYVVNRYQNEINNNNINYFLNKNYSPDIIKTEYDDEIVNKMMEVILRLKKYVNQMDDHNKQKSLKYLQNLIKLSELYD